MANNVAPVDALIRQVEARGGNPLAVFCYSLKDDPDRDDGVPAVFHDFLIDEAGSPRVDVIISTLSFTVARLGEETHTEATGPVVDLLERLDVPVIQAVLCTSSRAEWEASSAGLTPARHGDERRPPRVRRPDPQRRRQLQGRRRVRRPARHGDQGVCPRRRPRLVRRPARPEPRPAAVDARTPRSGSRSSSATTRPRTPGSATASGSTRRPR